MKRKAIIIGSGIGGIASAIRLTVKGYEVQVFEKSPVCGGKLTDFQLGNYRFDFGPSLFTMPQYVNELFELAGKKPSDYFTYKTCSESCRYFYEDKTSFIASTNKQKLVDGMLKTFDVDKKKLLNHLEENRKIFEKAGKIFLENSLHKSATWLNKSVVSSLFQSYVLSMAKSMHSVNSKRFKDKRLVQFYDRFATYNGSSPYSASAMLNSISTLEHDYGTYFPDKGMSDIVKSLEKLAIETGVKFHYNQLVNEIVNSNGKVSGIKIAGKTIHADIIVSNMDVNFTYSQLLKRENSRLERREKSSSAVIFYWGIKKDFKQLGLHNIFFSEDYETEFKEIFDDKKVPTDPTIYINISSKHAKKDAPVNCANWFTMVNVPADFGQNWDEEIIDLKKRIVKKLNRMLGYNINELIEEEFIADPRTIRDKTLSHKGALYGTSSNHMLAAFLRHPNFSSKFEGLYFVGGTVHPGGGIPLCLLSAKIVADLN